MTSEVFCPYCKTKRFKLVNEVGKYDVEIHCAQCGEKLGSFSSFSLSEGKDNAESND